MLRSPQEWGLLAETQVPVKSYMDEVLRSSERAYARFVYDIWRSGMIDFAFEIEDEVSPFFV